MNWVGRQESWAKNREVGWITYVNDPSVADVLAQEADVSLSGNGVLFQLGSKMPSYQVLEDVARGEPLRDALARAGKLTA